MARDNTTRLARALRLAVVRNVWLQDLVTSEQAKDLLRGRLSPDDPATQCDDSELFDLPADEALASIWNDTTCQ